MQNPNKLMSAAATAFALWRQNRSHPTQATPAKLQQQAVALLDHFPTPQVVAKLNVNSTILKRWANDIKDQNNFISLPDVIEPLPRSGQLNLELAFTNGCVMRLDGDISPAQLTAITQSVATQNVVAL